MSLTIAPIGLRAANAYVTDLHRHHGPTRGHKFSIACLANDLARQCQQCTHDQEKPCP